MASSKINTNNGGLYVLSIRVFCPTRIAFAIRKGRPVTVNFEPGWYRYVGSAKENRRQGLERHFDRHARVRLGHGWHVDQLIVVPNARPLGAVLVPSTRFNEDTLNVAVGSAVSRRPVTKQPKFGASDCKTGCPTYLCFSPRRVAWSDLLELDQEAERYGGES